MKKDGNVALYHSSFNPLPNKKNIDWSKLEALADNNLKVVKRIFVLDRVENIVGKGENAGYQHFLLFYQCFQKPSCPSLLKVEIMWERVNPLPNNINFNPLLHKYSFYHINNRLLLKTLWEKKKLLVMSNFSFSYNVFYSSR